MSIRNRSRVVALLLIVGISSFYGFHNLTMWEKALTFSKDSSAALSALVEASDWLSKNLEQDEIALVPTLEVFTALNPQMRDKLVDFHTALWKSRGIVLQANTTIEEVQKVRSYFIDFLKENPRIKYIVRDWNDPYATRLFEAVADDELMFLLREVKTFPFTLSKGWSSKVIIYERVRYMPLFVMKLTSPPIRYNTIPSNTSVQFSWSGATIQKVGSSVGFYLPLEAGIQASKQHYLTMQIKLDIESLKLLIVFYYDKNRDGRFSGYEIDYTKGAIFNQTKQGWLRGTWYKIILDIPKADDTIVQIAIGAEGDKDGAITLSDLVVYTEITPDLVLVEASEWLSENLKENEFAMTPTPAIFYLAEPELRYKLVHYSSLWVSARVTLTAGITNEEVLKVRSYFVDFAKGNTTVKYVIRDWVDPFAERLFEAVTSDELMFLLREVKSMFYTATGGWSRKITIYETVHYTSLIAMNLSSRPAGAFTYPKNASIVFDSNGTTIQKWGPYVGFYIPLQAGINASKQNYFTMRFQLNVENIKLTIVFYYDRNGDGKFTNYTTDYTKGWLFYQTRQGWIKGEWYQLVQTIPTPEQLNHSVVQIAISAEGDEDGLLTLANFAVYTEVTA